MTNFLSTFCKVCTVGGLLCYGAPVVLAQSGPPFPTTQGYIPTPAEWLLAFQNKQDILGYLPLNSAGGAMSGPLITTASTAAQAGLTLPPE
jgi:hypothetical protein